MRIQHNIMAMNSYRNLSGNNSALGKNLEKLSSGYRINRAGDDAAGLAISEKMRAQIAGLDQAQKNAQSGINLVKTAEGALTEVHDMLNRMVTLASQSANGTYTATDREKLQAEVDALTAEIDRIAENSNFNGTKLLDGSLDASRTKAADVIGTGIVLTDTSAVSSLTTMNALSVPTGNPNPITAAKEGDSIRYNLSWTDSEGNEQNTNVELTYQKNDKGTWELAAKDGTVYALAKNDTTTNGTATELGNAIFSELQKDAALNEAFTVKNGANGAYTFTSTKAGTPGAEITGVSFTSSDSSKGFAASINPAAASTSDGVDAAQVLDLSKAAVLAAPKANAEATAEELENATFEIAGKKFILVDGSAKVAQLKNLDPEVNVIKLTGTKYVATDDAATVASELSRITGKDFTVAAGANAAGIKANDIVYNYKDVADKLSTMSTQGGNSLTLQIGADSVETINVTAESMKAADLGIADLDIGDVASANKAIDTIKAAIEKVSVTRGNLGAVQNRLEHTINNLGVMEENITDAESNIRDTDIADEMMAYTKNNILIQSAQAMLAQANQVPQGVLQLMG